jgi:lysozyme
VRLSAAGLKTLMHEEGKRNNAYPDPATGGEPWTIGVGHTGPDVYPGLYWSDEQIMAALAKDVKWAEDAVNQNVTYNVNQEQFDALVEFAFNIGGPQFARSTLVKKLNAGNVLGAADEFLKWNIPAMLVPRRHRTRAAFLGKGAPAPKANIVYLKLEDVQRVVGVPADGLWGPVTKQAVIDWQRKHGLVPDGIVGPATAKAMGLV